MQQTFVVAACAAERLASPHRRTWGEDLDRGTTGSAKISRVPTANVSLVGDTDRVRLRRQAAMFKETSVESLTLTIELFNRPSPLARDHAVIMLLAHSFEMLLKASIFQRRGTVRDRGDSLSHSLLRCIDISTSDLGTLTAEEHTLLLAVKQHRDCATHDSIVMSDDLLYIHMRAGISCFRRLLLVEFGENLTDLLPSRVIPVSAAPPSDLRQLVEEELAAIGRLLAPGKRKAVEASARLRPLLSLDGSATGRSDQPTQAEVDRAARAFRDGKDWRTVLPGLARLQIGTAVPGGDAQEVVLQISKDPESVPVRRARAGEEHEALAYRGVNTFDEFGIKLTTFGDRLGVTQREGYAIIDALGLNDDDRAYHMRKTKAGNIQFQGLSARAIESGKAALADPAFDLQAAVKRYGVKTRRRA